MMMKKNIFFVVSAEVVLEKTDCSSGFVEDDAEISLVGLCLISMMMKRRRESLLCVCVFLFFVVW